MTLKIEWHSWNGNDGRVRITNHREDLNYDVNRTREGYTLQVLDGKMPTMYTIFWHGHNDRWQCDCGDARFQGQQCKHLRAIERIPKMSRFQKATKKQLKLRLALCGPTGSGKTYTALKMATNLGKKVAVIDTEHGSASKYADLFEFDVLELTSYSPREYVEAIKDAVAEGYEVIVIDSLSHAWMGKDGALQQVDNVAARTKSGNSFTAWREVTPLHNEMIEAMLSCKAHLIVTMRSKTEYIMEEVKGKMVPRKVGMAPIQRDGVEYEFDVVGDMDQENTLVISKSRCPELSNQVIRKPGKEVVGTLTKWLGNGETVKEQPQPEKQPSTTGKQHNMPATGFELQNRLYEYDAKLAKQGLCKQGELVEHVVNAGVRAGYDADISTWTGAAILLASEETKSFEGRQRKPKSYKQRIYDYDTKLANQGLCENEDLVKHIISSGKEKYGADLDKWTSSEAVAYAAKLTKEFESECRELASMRDAEEKAGAA